MKHYEVMINNGDYPLIYKCSTIAEAYGCLMEVSGWAFRGGDHAPIDPDALMESLAGMRRGKYQSYGCVGFSVYVRDGEV